MVNGTRLLPPRRKSREGCHKEIIMNLSSLRNALLSTVVSVGALSASPAWAIPIEIGFNFVPNGTLTANTGDVTTATTITSGAPDTVTTILVNNIGLPSGTV